MRKLAGLAVLGLLVSVIACSHSGTGITKVRLVGGTDPTTGVGAANWQGACSPNCTGGLQVNEECVGSPGAGFADIKQGATVTAVSQDGKVVGSATLGPGSLDNIGKGADGFPAYDCVFQLSQPLPASDTIKVAGALTRPSTPTEVELGV